MSECANDFKKGKRRLTKKREREEEEEEERKWRGNKFRLQKHVNERRKERKKASAGES